MFTDDTLLTFGKYKFVRLCRVPPEYLLAIHKNKTALSREVMLEIPSATGKELLEYIEANLERIQARQRGEIDAPEIELTCEKLPFPNEKAAKAEIRRIQAREQENQKKPVRAYECEKCSAWHLTSITIEVWKNKPNDK